MKSIKKIKGNKYTASKAVLIMVFIIIIVLLATSCSKPFFISGVSLGYFIWQDNEGNIHVSLSSDREKSNFTGTLTTDGRFDNVVKSNFEENDELDISESNISFDCSLDEDDYSEEISFKCNDYNYIEANLKINGQADLNRINIGKFLNSPDQEIFRIKPGYFETIKTVPWFKNHPFIEFFKKAYSIRYFTFIYVFLLGVILIEILRITKFQALKRKGLTLLISYIALLIIDFGFLIFLWYVNAH